MNNKKTPVSLLWLWSYLRSRGQKLNITKGAPVALII